ncbi:biotin--[acetyl-CoA-carboxylase] ligase [Eubacterium barkeri]|uniref:Bifunctional ligase/repressor BirA n=1 Tax=Eubacterium barkeri TaxID=1528 RepID=A0A1H3AXA7_EUBBA|nr:biotin--[acetyl-CoA-carboxylase] ligase [Eubacterium barkeri]SDX34342.1 BirA family transcriptional regulator, biotin operon repressor / biotin-[acetyl-CoA-carboxylase] ligase [Eubacterium barkeri]
MQSYQEVLKLLQENQGNYLSGEEMGARLGISRGAIWKAIETLRRQGIRIDSKNRCGYAILEADGRLTPSAIALELGDAQAAEHIAVYDSLPSTNTFLREEALAGAPAGRTIIADTQTGGRGRMGRHFFSPPGSGIYLSVLYRPTPDSTLPQTITMAASVVIAQAIEAVTGQSPGIKWVNDLYLDGLKIAGILTEASVNIEAGGVDHMVLGVGINLYAPEGGFPEDIKAIAGSLYPSEKPTDPTLRLRLTAALIKGLWQLGHSRGIGDYIEDYRARSILIGEEVIITAGNHQHRGQVIGFDDSGHLLLSDNDGPIKNISSGEITLRIAATRKDTPCI